MALNRTPGRHRGENQFLPARRRLASLLGVTVTSRRNLSEADFLATFVAPMRDVTQSAGEIVDLWGYLDPILSDLYPEADASGWEWRVAFIRESGDSRVQHIGVPVPRDNTYLVVVVDVSEEVISGHHLLDLGEKYGLSSSAT